MYLNPFKAKIAEGHATVGTFLSINSPATAEILSNVGFDWLIVDMEHGTIDLETASIMLSVMKGSHIIRVPSNDQRTYGHTGSDG
jgi:4-hydroxy-2-oxoheptanedioate aldolase